MFTVEAQREHKDVERRPNHVWKVDRSLLDGHRRLKSIKMWVGAAAGIILVTTKGLLS